MPGASGLPNRTGRAVRYYENKEEHCYHYWFCFVLFLSSKPEVKNTLFEERDQRRKRKPGNEEARKKRDRTEPNETQPINATRRTGTEEKSFSSTENSSLNRLLRDLKFKQ